MRWPVPLSLSLSPYGTVLAACCSYAPCVACRLPCRSSRATNETARLEREPFTGVDRTARYYAPIRREPTYHEPLAPAGHKRGKAFWGPLPLLPIYYTLALPLLAPPPFLPPTPTPALSSSPLSSSPSLSSLLLLVVSSARAVRGRVNIPRAFCPLHI